MRRAINPAHMLSAHDDYVRSGKLAHTVIHGSIQKYNLMRKSIFGFQISKALCADTLTVVVNDIVGVAAENACGIIFLKNNSFVVHEDLHRILDVEVKHFAELHRKHDSAKFIDFAYDTC